MATAIVTGGTRGLGLETANALHQLGWTVVIDGRDQAALSAAVGRIGDDARLVAISGDITDAAHRARLVAAAAATGSIDAVVNNASSIGSSPMPSLATVALEEWRAVAEVNVVAPLALIQEAMPWIEADGGRLVNISSDAAVEAYEGWGAYGSTKAALDHLTRILAAEHPDVGVYSVDPGDMQTELHQAAFPGEDISDRPSPAASVPGLLAVLLGELPSGRYVARDLAAVDPDPEPEPSSEPDPERDPERDPEPGRWVAGASAGAER